MSSSHLPYMIVTTNRWIIPVFVWRRRSIMNHTHTRYCCDIQGRRAWRTTHKWRVLFGSDLLLDACDYGVVFRKRFLFLWNGVQIYIDVIFSRQRRVEHCHHWGNHRNNRSGRWRSIYRWEYHWTKTIVEINLQHVDSPVCRLKCFRMIFNVISTTQPGSCTCAILSKCGISPISCFQISGSSKNLNVKGLISPQKVTSKTICWFMKWELISHPFPPTKVVFGGFHREGSGASPSTSSGSLPRSKNQWLIWSEVHSIA